VSANVLGLSALLATQMPYDQVREVLRLFTAYVQCIHDNGDWDAFLAWALPRLASPTDERPVPRIQRVTPAPVPQLARRTMCRPRTG
jgi:hypothetical protein